MIVTITPEGDVRALYSDEIDWSALGEPAIRRASHVEPDASGLWWADLAPVGGPVLGPYRRRAEALTAEVAWIEAHVL